MPRVWKRCEVYHRDNRKSIIEQAVGLSPNVPHYAYCPIHEKTKQADEDCHYCMIITRKEPRYKLNPKESKKMPTAKLNSKRIQSITIKRMLDTDPDTSWLGEYSNKPNSKYSIDRAHSEGCNSVTYSREGGEKFDRISLYLDTRIQAEESEQELEALRQASDILYQIAQDFEDCDCTQGGRWNNREYRYFNPVHENYKGLEEAEIRQYCKQDYERMEAYNNQQWCFVGIRAEAKIKVQTGQSKYSREFDPLLNQTITSGGIWGIESDSDKYYFAGVEAEELSELRKTLEALGFSKRAISTAFKSVQHKYVGR